MYDIRVTGLKKLFLLVLTFLCLESQAALTQQTRVLSAFVIARLKYAGGGDWYNDPSAEPNLLTYIRQQTGLEVEPRFMTVEAGSEDLYSFPFVFLTGHGNIAFNETEIRRLRTYLENGGFLYADDDYGMDKAFRRELRRIFPEKELVELPYTYGLYSVRFSFPNGPPKTHEHDGRPPRGFGLFHHGRLVVYYTYESNPSDGWTDPEVHNDPESKREEALKFGTNVILWTLTH